LLQAVAAVQAENPGSDRIPWSKIAKNVPGRTDSQCRERYVNALNPDLKLSPWTPQVCFDR